MAKDPRAARLSRAIANLTRKGEYPGLGPVGLGPVGGRSVDLDPKSAHEALTRQMVTDLGDDLDEVKGRVNALIGVVLGAVVVNVVMQLVGAG